MTFESSCAARGAARAAVMALAVLNAGCSAGLKYVPAKGRVTLNGKPLPDAAVRFFPATRSDGVAGPVAVGLTDAEGRFELNSMTGQRGAVVGTHRVTVNEPEPEPPLGGEFAAVLPDLAKVRPRATRHDPNRIPKVYKEIATTPFQSLEVSAGVGEITLDLQSVHGPKH